MVGVSTRGFLRAEWIRCREVQATHGYGYTHGITSLGMLDFGNYTVPFFVPHGTEYGKGRLAVQCRTPWVLVRHGSKLRPFRAVLV